ncbi:MAG: heme-copper oxidase subunit III [Acidobacteriota bacterium]|nr:heme-copper oxidase subunit III [Acidobacteriota bacterium]
MKVGTIETFETEKPKRRVGLSSGFGTGGGSQNNGGGGGGSDGGGGGDKKDDYIAEVENYPSNKFRIGMWFLLCVVMMTFGGLMSAYIVVATNGVMEWKPFDLPIQVWISTAFILASSITYQFAQNALYKDNQTKAKNWLLATTVLGGVFIASQLLAWLELVQRGVYMQSNPYAGFFYILTAVHALHVIGGIAALGYIVLRTWLPTEYSEELVKRQQISNTVGWYWHFMDGLWIVLLLLLGFWK